MQPLSNQHRIEVCRLARAHFGRGVYILILTAKTQSEDLVAAMQAGADDYVTKPLKSQELRIRLAAACRILDLEERLAHALGQTAAAAAARPDLSPDMSGRA